MTIRQTTATLALIASLASAVPALAEDVTVRFTTIQSPTYELSQELEQTFAEIEERTDGRVSFQPHYGSESGFQAKQYISALEYGMFDAALIPISTASLEFPWLGLYSLPFFAKDGADRRTMIEATQPILEEFSAEHNIVPMAYPLRADEWLVIYSKRDVSTLEDFSGMLIRTFDPSTQAIVTALGATPTALQKSELYMGLQRGTIDGAITGITDAEGMKFDEVVDNVFQLDVNLLPHILGFSQSVWDKIDAPDQETIREVFAAWDKAYADATLHSDGSDDAYGYARANGMKVILPDDKSAEVFAGIREKAIEAYAAQDDRSKAAYEAAAAALSPTSN